MTRRCSTRASRALPAVAREVPGGGRGGVVDVVEVDAAVAVSVGAEAEVARRQELRVAEGARAPSRGSRAGRCALLGELEHRAHLAGRRSRRASRRARAAFCASTGSSDPSRPARRSRFARGCRARSPSRAARGRRAPCCSPVLRPQRVSTWRIAATTWRGRRSRALRPRTQWAYSPRRRAPVRRCAGAARRGTSSCGSARVRAKKSPSKAGMRGSAKARSAAPAARRRQRAGRRASPALASRILESTGGAAPAGGGERGRRCGHRSAAKPAARPRPAAEGAVRAPPRRRGADGGSGAVVGAAEDEGGQECGVPLLLCSALARRATSAPGRFPCRLLRRGSCAGRPVPSRV